MKWLLVVGIVLLVLLFILVLSKLKISVDYFHGQDNDHLHIVFKIWFGLIRYKIDVPVIKVDEDSPSIVVKEETETEAGTEGTTKKKDTKKFTPEELLKSFSDMNQLLKHVIGLHRIIRSFLGKVQITELEWHSVIGIGDAAYTGMLTGAFWAVKGSIIGALSHYMKLKKSPKLSITPHFQLPISQTRLTCMIQFRIGHAMLAGIKLVKFWKGGRPKFKSQPLSQLSNSKTKSL
ncbi:DUF2953 domain-containing protein [Cytobacillus spongiae]|nr:DUF2953 domain-containing protein [Cytobacillus spongiae]UII57977.1 DUF2953 domain-containing protein [Cytobacillus spongiae]